MKSLNCLSKETFRDFLPHIYYLNCQFQLLRVYFDLLIFHFINLTKKGLIIMNLFAAIFTIGLILANIFFFIKKKYLYLFIPCILFLPSYYGFDISPSLPVLSVSRIMYFVFYIYVFLNKKKAISFNNFKKMPKEYYFIGLFFTLRIISIMFNMPSNSYALKALFSVIFENILLIYGLFLLAPTKEEVFNITKSIVYIGSILFFVGIFESITFLRPFDFLYTVSRDIFNDYYIRLGYLRSTTTMCMPNYFSNICLFLAPIIFYLHRVTGYKRYLFFCVLNFLALVHSGSRSNIICYFFILVIYVLLTILNKEYMKFTIKSFIVVFISIAIIITLTSTISSRAEYFYSGTAKSILNVFGFNYDLNEGAPTEANGYGNNSHTATYSRFYQLSGAKNALSQNPLFGIGYGAIELKKIKYQWKSHISIGTTIDSGLVEILIYEGLLGLAAYILLFINFVQITFKNIHKFKDNISIQTVVLVTICYFLSLLSTTNMPIYLSLIIFFYILVYSSHEE